MRLSKTRKETLKHTQANCMSVLTESIRAERKAFNRIKFTIIQDDTKKPNRKKNKEKRRPRTVDHSNLIIRKSLNTNKYSYNPLITKKGSA